MAALQRNQIRALIESSAASLIVAEMIALLTAGLEDQAAFLFWTMPLLLLIAGMVAILIACMPPLRPAVACVVGMTGGACLGFLWTIFVALRLGPWMGAFGVPVLLCWVAAGVVGGGTGVLSLNQSIGRAACRAATLALVVLLLALTMRSLTPYLSGDRTVTIVCLRYVPGDERLVIDQSPRLSPQTRLREEEKEAIQSVVESGRLSVVSSGTYGSGPRTRIIFIMSGPLGAEKVFVQPKHGFVVYMQRADGWTTVPRDTEMLDRSVRLTERTGEYEAETYIQTMPEVEHADGSRSGGGGYNWYREE